MEGMGAMGSVAWGQLGAMGQGWRGELGGRGLMEGAPELLFKDIKHRKNLHSFSCVRRLEKRTNHKDIKI